MADNKNNLSLFNNTLAFNPAGNLRNIGAAYRKNAPSAQQSASPAAPSGDTASISETAKAASSLYDKVKATGSENAAIFRSALVSMASNYSANASSFSNFLSLGAAMAESGNMKVFTDLTMTVASLKGINSAPGTQEKVVRQAKVTASAFGFESAGEFASAAKTIVSKTQTADEKVSRAGVLNSFTKLLEKTSNATGMTVEEKKGALSRIARTVESKGTLSEMNDFINEKLKALGEKEGEEEKPAGAGLTAKYSLAATNGGGAGAGNPLQANSAAIAYQKTQDMFNLAAQQTMADLAKMIELTR